MTEEQGTNGPEGRGRYLIELRQRPGVAVVQCEDGM